MEEKKVDVEMPVQDRTYTENEVRDIVNGLKSQNAQLIYQLQNANMNNMFKRLDYLFKVIENAAMFDEPFVEQCVSELKELMTPPTPETEEKTKE